MKLKKAISFFIVLMSFNALFAQQVEVTGILGDNFHEIDPGLYYRSAQLSAKSLKKYISKYGIRSVINLRGASEKDWYLEEKNAVEEQGASLYDISMSARRLPHREDLLKLLDLFENLEYPILVHCQGGADRTGEASAIYQMMYMGKDKKQALKMLSLKYHHLSWRMPAKKYFIKKLWHGADWAIENYEPCANDWKHYDKEKYCKSMGSAF